MMNHKRIWLALAIGTIASVVVAIHSFKSQQKDARVEVVRPSVPVTLPAREAIRELFAAKDFFGDARYAELRAAMAANPVPYIEELRTLMPRLIEAPGRETVPAVRKLLAIKWLGDLRTPEAARLLSDWYVAGLEINERPQDGFLRNGILEHLRMPDDNVLDELLDNVAVTGGGEFYAGIAWIRANFKGSVSVARRLQDASLNPKLSEPRRVAIQDLVDELRSSGGERK